MAKPSTCAWLQSKLANVLYTYELDRRLKPQDNCTANTLHPGVVGTNLWRCVFCLQVVSLQLK